MVSLRIVKIAALLMLLTIPAQASDGAKTQSVDLTADDIQTIAAGLNIAAATCVQDPNGCIVGYKKAAVLAKLNEAMKKLQAENK